MKTFLGSIPGASPTVFGWKMKNILEKIKNEASNAEDVKVIRIVRNSDYLSLVKEGDYDKIATSLYVIVCDGISVENGSIYFYVIYSKIFSTVEAGEYFAINTDGSIQKINIGDEFAPIRIATKIVDGHPITCLVKHCIKC